MCDKLFSSLVLREIIDQIGSILIEEIGLHNDGRLHKQRRWAEKITTTYREELKEHPVLYLTESEESKARKYLAFFKSEEIDVAENATRLIRSKHATDIREFLKIKHGGWPLFAEHEDGEKDHYTFPKDDQAPACFTEWFAVTSVWRLTLALPRISYQDATIGTDEKIIHPLPKEWEEKLEECLKVTEASAIVPVPKNWDLPLRRRDLDSILPTEKVDTHETGLLTNGIITSWFRILVARRDETKSHHTVLIPPDSTDLAGSTPPEIVKRICAIGQKPTMVLFPTIIKEDDHYILLVGFPRLKALTIMDSGGSKTTARLAEGRSWLKENLEPKGGQWEVRWINCPHPGSEVASGVFMLINALSILVGKNPVNIYTREDATFLRRYVAAVICMGKLPDKIQFEQSKQSEHGEAAEET